MRRVHVTADEYLQRILAAITAAKGALGPGPTVRDALRPLIQRWAGTQLNELKLSGSYVKGTAIVGGTDVDLFISLKSDTTNPLREIYDSLASHMSASGYTVRRQNVSIGITQGTWSVDLTPGKQQQPASAYHSIWVSRQSTWQQTNVDLHVKTVGGSGQTDLIRLMKRWRQVHSLEFPSFALELAVLRAMQENWQMGIAARVLAALEFFRDRIATVALTDPANTNNNVADELTVAEKATISRQARASRAAETWAQTIW